MGGEGSMAEGLFMALMQPPKELEDDFNRVYENEHLPTLAKAPGVRSAKRYKLESVRAGDDLPKYLAIYELDSLDVLQSEEWQAGANSPEWMSSIRDQCDFRIVSTWKRLED
jgi:hypothetical protein